MLNYIRFKSISYGSIVVFVLCLFLLTCVVLMADNTFIREIGSNANVYAKSSKRI